MNAVIEDFRFRANRLSRLCDLIETMDGPDRQRALIECLREGGFLSDGCAALLVEHYAGEHA